MHYELTDTNVKMKDTFGNELERHPICIVEADSPEEALDVWRKIVQHDLDPELVTIKLLT